MKYYIKTFGCQMNEADSERIASLLGDRGMKQVKSIQNADYFVINSCMVRASAEHRVYGLVRNLSRQREKTGKPKKIVLAGCMVGAALSDKRGKLMRQLREKLPDVDEFLPMSEVGFDYLPNRSDRKIAWVPISNGCNNFCSFCVVPFTRGREVSRPFEEIMNECRNLKKKGYKEVLLIGQNVNSYGSDLIQKSNIKSQRSKTQIKTQKLTPVYVKHLGRYRIPTLFPHLLEEVAKIGFEKVDFISSNPWDFSDELIDVIVTYPNITRYLHLAVQSGDDEILRKMNRWYTAQEYVYDKIEVGVRVEFPEAVMREHTDLMYEPIFELRTRSFDDIIRTFCPCPHGMVAIEEYRGYVCVNGHTNSKHDSHNSNFALVTEIELTDPLENTTLYAQSIAELATTLGGGKPILQRLADLRAGRRSTWTRINKSYIEPTLKEVTPGDISMGIPYRILKNILEGLERLDLVLPGVNSGSTLLYAPEVKYRGSRIMTDKNLQTKFNGLYVAGDGAGVSGNIIGAAATGIMAARGMLSQ